MYHRSLFIILLLLLLSLSSINVNAEDDSDDESTSSSDTSSSTTQPSTSETNSADESTNPVNEDIYNSKNYFTTPPLVTDITDTVQVKLYCEVDKDYCKKVEHSLVLAAASFAQVVILKNKIV